MAYNVRSELLKVMVVSKKARASLCTLELLWFVTYAVNRYRKYLCFVCFPLVLELDVIV